MTYGRVRYTVDRHTLKGAAVSHLAELVRGDFLASACPKAPSTGPSGHLLPKGRRAAASRSGAPLRPVMAAAHSVTPKRSPQMPRLTMRHRLGFSGFPPPSIASRRRRTPLAFSSSG